MISWQGDKWAVEVTLPTIAACVLRAAFLQLAPSGSTKMTQYWLGDSGTKVDPDTLVADSSKVFHLEFVSQPTHPFVDDLTATVAKLVLENRRLRAAASAYKSSHSSHVSIFNSKKGLLKKDPAKVLGDAPALLHSDVACLWPKLRQAPLPSRSETSHQAATETVVAAILHHLHTTKRSCLVLKPKVNLDGSVPDLAFFLLGDTVPTWNSLILSWEVEAYTGTADTHYNEGMGQVISYMSKQFRSTRQASVVGVFSNSITIEILRHEMRGTPDEVIHSTGLVDFLRDSDEPSEGFVHLVHLLSLEPVQLGCHPKTVHVDGADVELGRLLGRGGWSHVYECSISGSPVVVKIPNNDSTLVTEYEVLRELSGTGCPNSIPSLHPSSPAAATSLITTRVGLPLSEYIRKHGTEGKLSEQQACSVLECVIAALQWAHSREWIHLDVRVQNIVVDVPEDPTHPTVQLVDWNTSAWLHRKGSGLRGLRGMAANAILRSGDDSSDWFAVPSMDWESSMFLYVWLVTGTPLWFGLESCADMLAQREAEVAKHADANMMKQLRSLLVAARDLEVA
jgi:hypothetical protein